MMDENFREELEALVADLFLFADEYAADGEKAMPHAWEAGYFTGRGVSYTLAGKWLEEVIERRFGDL